MSIFSWEFEALLKEKIQRTKLMFISNVNVLFKCGISHGVSFW